MSATNLVVCKAFYFFFFSSFVLRFIYTPVYLKQLGLSPSYVGILSGTGPVLRAFGGLFFCYIADKTKSRKVIFVISVLAAAATPFLTTLVQPHKQFCPMESPTPLPSKQQQRLSNFSQTKNVADWQLGRASISKESGKEDSSSLGRERKISQNKKAKYDAWLLGLYDRQVYSVNSHSSLSKSHPRVKKSKNEYDLREHVSDMSEVFTLLLAITLVGDFVGGSARNLADVATLHALGDTKSKYLGKHWPNDYHSFTLSWCIFQKNTDLRRSSR